VSVSVNVSVSVSVSVSVYVCIYIYIIYIIYIYYMYYVCIYIHILCMYIHTHKQISGRGCTSQQRRRFTTLMPIRLLKRTPEIEESIDGRRIPQDSQEVRWFSQC
jgi:hypothetical protein